MTSKRIASNDVGDVGDAGDVRDDQTGRTLKTLDSKPMLTLSNYLLKRRTGFNPLDQGPIL